MSERLIEAALPVEKLSEEARREKAIRHGHISTLHVWWARRPLVVARAAVFASLVDADAMEQNRFQDFVAKLCKWEVHDGDPGGHHLLERARAMIRERFPDGPPKVLDSFAGGGSIPLEALRLGCEAHAVEYNPVAYLILKATIEYPQKYGAKLAEDVRRWGEWVLEKARGELAQFYPPGPNGETVVAYIWSRTVRCPNPNCGAEIPLFRQFWLARKPNKKVALFPVPDRESRRVNFRVLEGAQLEEAMREGFDPSEGTVSRANARCLVCGTGAKDDYIRSEAREGRMGHRLVALVTTRGRGEGRNYHIARPEDQEAFQRAAKRLEELKQTPSPWANGLSWVPEEPMDQNNPNIVSGRGYGIKQWHELFNPRQLLALVTFGKWVREAIRQIAQETDPEYAKAVGTYLAFVFDRLADYNSILCSWYPQREIIRNTFSGHHLHMLWDYVEASPLDGPVGFSATAGDWVIEAIENEADPPRGRQSVCHLGSATRLSAGDGSLDAVITDPPYYDNVPYADLSDFFYCLLPGSLIVTEQGYVPIEQVKVGMRVLSHTQRWTRVVGVSQRHYRGKVFSINVAHCNLPLQITPGHKVLARKRKATKPAWIPSEQLEEGDYILFPTLLPQQDKVRSIVLCLSDQLEARYPSDGNWLYYGRVSEETLAIHQSLARVERVEYGTLKRIADSLGVRHGKVRRLRHTGMPKRLRVPNQIPVDTNFATLVGYYLAEGSVTLRNKGRHVIQFAFSNEEEEYIQEVERLMAMVFGVNGRRNYRDKEKAIVLVFHCAPVAEFFARTFGRNSANKSLPGWFLDLPNEELAALVRGYWRGDGNIGDEFCQLTTTSAALAGQIRVILQRLGVITHTYLDAKERTTKWNGKIVRSRPRFMLKAWGRNRSALASIVGMPVTSKQEGRYLGEWGEIGYWLPIRRIDLMDYAGPVYNLETEDHSYTTAQGCVHNCWLKRTVGDLYPEAFRWELTPKDEEAVVNPARFGGGKKGEEIARRHYERLMGEAFREIYRVLKPEGIAVIMFTHRSTAAWESLIKSLLSAGLYPTASWPVHTEMEASTHQRGKGAVRSTILMACRKRPQDAGIGWYHQIRDELHSKVRERLVQFWGMGLRGADFFISAIGPAVGVFGRYKSVKRPDGREVDVGELLSDVRALVSNFALEQLGGDLGQVDAPTRFYVLWRWAYGGEELEFDEANKLAKSLGAELDELALTFRLARRKGEIVSLPDFMARSKDEVWLRIVQQAVEGGKVHQLPIIDALHLALLFWRKGEREAVVQLLTAGGFQEENSTFWRVAQALYEVEGEAGSPEEELKVLGQMLPASSSLVREAKQIVGTEVHPQLPFSAE